MEIILRIINAGDTEAVTKLSEQLGYEISALQTKSNIDALMESGDNKTFIAVYENKLVGWINVAYTILIESLPFCEIRGLVVDEAYRKNNIGTMLVERAKQWSREKSCSHLRVRCNVKRKDTHAFYMHLGFTEKKEQKVFEINV